MIFPRLTKDFSSSLNKVLHCGLKPKNALNLWSSKFPTNKDSFPLYGSQICLKILETGRGSQD